MRDGEGAESTRATFFSDPFQFAFLSPFVIGLNTAERRVADPSDDDIMAESEPIKNGKWIIWKYGPRLRIPRLRISFCFIL